MTVLKLGNDSKNAKNYMGQGEACLSAKSLVVV